ncbi:hypothetical protein [Phytomonospora endophytica]|uniref:Uncharacterized protein n=1 Tax=Phytomonospora endophytica TaxID=714109 RepID=A0A841FKH7_9ACTN|nr:hypothetical protein [Phytomonospora endophytica]MBB6036385.1 hypothetical protein [Phytomonospora endophytica]GIG65706.1 hypothetical protein Pen01_20010 [Phytomonospora endophytica]
MTNTTTTRPTTKTLTATGLAAGAVGILMLYLAGIEFPFFPPPGMLIATAGALAVAFVRWRWITLLGPVLGAFYWIGLFGSGTAGYLLGDEDVLVTAGIWVQMAGVTVAFASGIAAVTAGRRRSVAA